MMQLDKTDQKCSHSQSQRLLHCDNVTLNDRQTANQSGQLAYSARLPRVRDANSYLGCPCDDVADGALML